MSDKPSPAEHWLHEVYTGNQDASTMRFSAGEMIAAFNQGWIERGVAQQEAPSSDVVEAATAAVKEASRAGNFSLDEDWCRKLAIAALSQSHDAGLAEALTTIAEAVIFKDDRIENDPAFDAQQFAAEALAKWRPVQ